MRFHHGALRRVALLAVSFLVALLSLAFTPPPLDGAVVDTSGKLTAEDDRVLEEHLAAERARIHRQIGVLVVGSLGGETIEDVAYRTFNTWHLGDKEADDGVLLVIAVADRKTRIETGKGIGHLLTDLESNQILEKMRPALRQEHYREAILTGVDGIAAALAGEAKGAKPKAAPAGWTFLDVLPIVGSLSFFGFFGWFFFFYLPRKAKRDGATGSSAGGYSSSSSYESSSSSSSGGSDFSGGGGSSGGGGASSDW